MNVRILEICLHYLNIQILNHSTLNLFRKCFILHIVFLSIIVLYILVLQFKLFQGQYKNESTFHENSQVAIVGVIFEKKT